mmetsp:Transcript_100689/g.290985  ORF Transcript_100689/g.290985 Transcript_100689/m.290985 type:complete len:232 (-) Transcript_100689:74-769(-)
MLCSAPTNLGLELREQPSSRRACHIASSFSQGYKIICGSWASLREVAQDVVATDEHAMVLTLLVLALEVALANPDRHPEQLPQRLMVLEVLASHRTSSASLAVWSSSSSSSVLLPRTVDTETRLLRDVWSSVRLRGVWYVVFSPTRGNSVGTAPCAAGGGAFPSASLVHIVVRRFEAVFFSSEVKATSNLIVSGSWPSPSVAKLCGKPKGMSWPSVPAAATSHMRASCSDT